MNIKFDVFKRIGKEDYRAGNYSIDFLLNQPSFPKKNMLLDRPLSEILARKASSWYTLKQEFLLLKRINGTY